MLLEGETMKRNLLIAALVVTAVWMSGCVVIHTEKREPCSAAVGPDDVTIREIDAIGKLAFEDNRHSGYKNIAERPELGDRAQIHLIEAVFKRLAFEDAKVDVLLALVRNPSFSPAAKAVLLERLDRLAFEDNKRKILDALNEQRA